MTVTSLRAAILTAVATASIAAAPVAHAGSWLPVQQLSSAPSSAPLALFTATGEAVVVWGPSTPAYGWGPAGPAQSGAAADALVRVAVKEPGTSSFGASKVLSGPGATFYSMFSNPDGSVVVQWMDENGLQTATRPPFGSFGAPTTLVPPSELAAAGPGSEQPGSPGVEVSVDKRGDVLLVWGMATASQGEPIPHLWAQFRPAGGSFEAPVGIFDGAQNSVATFDSALDDHGDAFIGVVGVRDGSSSASAGAYMVERPAAGGGYSQPAPLSDPGEVVRTALYPSMFGPQPFTVDGNGDVAFAWQAAPPGAPGNMEIRAAVREHGQWLPTQTIWPHPPAEAHEVPMGTSVSAGWGPAGQLGVAWIDSTVFDFSYRPPGGPFGAVETMPGLPAFWAINLGFDSLGDTVALPIITDLSLVNNDGMLTATVRPARGGFQPAATLGPTQNGTASLTMDSFGDGIASWTGLTNHEGDIFAAYYDAKPPAVTQLAVQSTPLARAAKTNRTPRLTSIRFRVSKPGVIRLTLASVTCRRVNRRTVCSTRKLADLKQAARAGSSTVRLTASMTRALRKAGQYRLTAQEVDGPGRVSASRTTRVVVR
jgi:hypothetical protein